MSKTRIAVCMLLLLLLLSLFTALNILPVEATVEDASLGLDTFALKEYKQWSAYNPAYAFSKSSSSALQVMSTTTGLGQGYVFMHVDKDYLHGKKLSVRWRWFADWSGGSYELAKLYVVDNAHHRRNSDGEFRTQSDIEHPIAGYTSVYVMGRSATANGGWVSWETQTETVNLAGFRSSVVTILFKASDDWVGFRSGMAVDYLRILSPSNEVLKEYEFGAAHPKNVFMDITGSTGDYGLVRKPRSVLYGTEDYIDVYAPDGELYLSQQVSDYIYSVFDYTGKYPSGYLMDAWGSLTTHSYANSYTSSSEQVADYSAVFYKGHIAFLGMLGYQCGYPGCTLLHYGVWSRFKHPYYQPIKDYEIGASVNFGRNAANRFYGTHDFVFLWVCGLGENGRVGVYNQAHSSGLLSSWMDIDPRTLSTDGYKYPDDSDHVFISFEGVSIWYAYEAQMRYRYYSQFVSYFFNRTLTAGRTVYDALNDASYLVNGVPFGASQLYKGYTVLIGGNLTLGRMRVWGDGNHRLPR